MRQERFTIDQLVKVDGRNATVVCTESDGVHVVFDDAGPADNWEFYMNDHVEPRSIKKSDGAEGKNFID